MKPETLAALQVWLRDRIDFCDLSTRREEGPLNWKELWRARLTAYHEIESQINWLLDKEKR